MHTKKWSRKFTCCIVCSRTSVRHTANGRCKACHERWLQLTNPVYKLHAKELKRKWYLKNKHTWPARRDKFHFGGNRAPALERDGHKCALCSSTKNLVVHHNDKSGRGAAVHNNTLSNLLTLCRVCHPKVHGELNGWSRKYPACITCGTTKRKHNANGLCWKCYRKKQYDHTNK